MLRFLSFSVIISFVLVSSSQVLVLIRFRCACRANLAVRAQSKAQACSFAGGEEVLLCCNEFLKAKKGEKVVPRREKCFSVGKKSLKRGEEEKKIAELVNS